MKIIKLLFFILIILSCKKDFFLKEYELKEANYFRHSANLNHTVLRVINYLETLEKKQNYISSFVKQNGVPLWDKSIVQEPLKASRGNLEGVVDTIVIIPIQDDQYTYISSFIIARVNDVINLKFFRAADYLKYAESYSDLDTINQRKSIEQILWLNYKTYGYKKFRILNNQLFGNGYNNSNILDVKDGSELSYSERMASAYATICIKKPSPNGCSCADHSFNTCTCEIPDCCWITTCSTIYFSDYGAGQATSSSGNTSSSGSSTTSGSGGQSFPCPSLQGRFAPLIGCGPNNQMIILPVLDNPNEYDLFKADSVIIDTNFVNRYPCIVGLVDSLARFGNLNQRAQIALSTIFGVNKYIHIKLEIDSSLISLGFNGASTPGIGEGFPPDELDFYASIKINPEMLAKATKHFVIAIIVHESMHAYIDYYYKLYEHGYIDSNQVKATFPIFWRNGYFNNNATLQHNQIAKDWVSQITSALYAFDSTGIGNPVISADSIFKSFAWAGLHNTKVFSDLPNKCDMRAIQTVGRNTSITNPFTPDLPPGQNPCSNTYTLTSNYLRLAKRLCE